MLRFFSKWLGLATLSLALFGSAALAEPRHGLSGFGDLKYPTDFKHFEYVNPDAPKGGTLSLIGPEARNTFNSFNYFILKGDPAQGMEYLFDTLMSRADDEPDAMYGLVARTADLAEDGLSIVFELRPEAKFADGSPMTAEDVAYSLKLIKEKGSPLYSSPMSKVKNAEVLGPHKVRFNFAESNRDIPLIVAGTLPIFSKAYYTKNEFEKTTLEPPLGSGPYRITGWKQGRYVTYSLRDDYWGKDLPVNKGRFNFGKLRYEYFRDRTAGFEAFKAGVFDLREEFTSKSWATEYDIDQVKKGWIIADTLPDERPAGAQGFFLNMRRDKFSDPRVRQALDLAFDFEWTNKNLFYALYTRTNSFFENSAYKASGAPPAEELKLLEPLRASLPESVFGEAYVSPVSDVSGQDRRLLRKASRLLKQAGYLTKDAKRMTAKGRPFTIEFLTYSPSFERVIAPYIKNLKILGIDANIRLVDSAQYESRRKAFDFDIVSGRFAFLKTPGIELRNFFGSSSANASGSYNLSGVNSKAVDALVEDVVNARSRKTLTAAARALDRALRAQHFWVPHWYKAAHNVAYWNKFSRPKIKARFDRGIIETWWYDEAKAARN